MWAAPVFSRTAGSAIRSSPRPIAVPASAYEPTANRSPFALRLTLPEWTPPVPIDVEAPVDGLFVTVVVR